MNLKIYDILIIGGGPAGIFAASLAKIKGLKPMLIEINNDLGGQPLLLYSEKNIEDYPGYVRIKSCELISNLIQQFKSLDIPLLLKTTILNCKLIKNIFHVNLNNKKNIKTKTIILATGPGIFIPTTLQIKGSNHPKVQYYVRNIDIYHNKKIIVLGGGDSAVDWANKLSQITKKITIIHRRDAFRALGNNVNNLKKNGVKILLNYQILEIVNQSLVCKNNSTQKIVKIPFDYIIVQYGQVFSKETFKFVRNLNVDKNNRIPVNAAQATNLSNIYAIGNVCTYEGKPSSIICAHGEAAVAVRDILNKLKPYDQSKPH